MSSLVSREQFGLSVHVLIGAIFAGLALLLVLIVGWTLLKMWLHRAEKVRAERRRRADRFRPDGQPLPPIAPGLCDRCQDASDEVYHLPSGRRLCRHCFWSRSVPQTGRETSPP